MAKRLYLDHNATSPMRPEVRDLMVAAMAGPHNASSVHSEGRKAKAMLERARKDMADRLHAPLEGVVFTGSGTEADNLAVQGLVHGPAKVRTLFISAMEHDAIKAAATSLARTGVRVETLPVTGDGIIDLAWLEERLHAFDPDTDGSFAVYAMLANNETGVINPVGEIGPLVWPRGGYVVVDAVQGIGKLPLDFDGSGADVMTIAAHKIGGPVGVGALLMKPGLGLEPLLRGGGQEKNRRAGTENIPAILGFAKTIALADPSDYASLSELRDAIEAGLPAGVRIWGQGADRLPNTLCFSAPGFSSETQVMVMDLAGFAVSAGSACSSGKVKPSSTLSAMGASEAEAKSAVRVSLGWDTPQHAAKEFLACWCTEYNRIKEKDCAA